MTRPLLDIAGVSVSYGDLRALDDVHLTVEAGSVTGLIGPNGAGKTTLLDVLSGFTRPQNGTVTYDGIPLLDRPAWQRARLGIARTFQSLELFDDMSVRDNLLVAVESARRAGRPEPDLWDALGLRPDDPRRSAELSQNERAALAMARAVAARPRLLLLDEPAAGLDAAAREDLRTLLRRLADAGTAVVLVDHDLGLVLDTCDTVAVLDFGRVVASAPPAQVRADPRVAQAYVGRSAPSRPAPPSPAPAPGTGTVNGTAPVVVAEGLVAGYGAGDVVRGVDLQVRPGEIVALLGPNGAGKTTTLLALSGVLSDMRGRVEVLGRPVRRGGHRQARAGVAHVLQTRRVFAELTARDNLRLVDRDGAGTAEVLELLPALRPVLDRQAGRLSGGEQQMLALARALATRPRLLIVDELSLGLAPPVVEELLDALSRRSRDSGTAILLAEQHPQLALRVAGRAYVMAAGRIALEAPADELAADPDRLFAAYLGTA